MTQTALSRISGISQPTISDIENERHTPTALVAGDLAKALQLSVDYLVGLTDIARPLGAADTNTPYHADTPVLAIEQFASAGPGADALDEHVGQARYIQMQVHGDSMGDDIRDGDWVVFDRQREWPDSGFVVAVIEDKVYVKRAARRRGGAYALRDAQRHLVPGEVSTAFRVVQIRRDV